MPRSERQLVPEDLVTKGIRARRRFRALVRMVIANLPWLVDVEDEQLSRNVQKNVQLLTKRKGKKGLLTLAQKGILCKPAEDRTPEEKQMLHRIIGGLKCFRKYPEDVKLQLAAVTYFVYFGPNRVVVKQYQEAHALYFIISGEVNVAITTLDPVLREPICVNIGTMIAGSMFGEVSLLHEIPRTATITTITPCEMLCLKKPDFDIVLKASVKKQWDQIQNAMARFAYFDGWDEVAVRECCIYSKIKPYVRNQTILGDGEGISTSAYFLLKGKCKLIEQLMTRVWYDSAGKKCYDLYIPPESSADKETMQDVVKRTILDEKKSSITSLPDRRSSIFRRMRPGQRSRKSLGSVTMRSMRPDRSKSPVSSSKRSFAAESTATMSVDTIDSGAPQMEKQAKQSSSMKQTTDVSTYDLPMNTESHFMQVCIFSEMACFGIGESMKRRRIIAMSDYVECLLIPRYWLFQHNRGNVWSRIQQYLDSQIPSSQQVFKEFVTQRKWLKYRSHLAKELFGKPPVTALYNVPYSIRINEDIDFE